jgi:hypothetical protein
MITAATSRPPKTSGAPSIAGQDSTPPRHDPSSVKSGKARRRRAVHRIWSRWGSKSLPSV